MQTGAKVALIVAGAVVVGIAALLLVPPAGPGPRTDGGQNVIEPAVHGYDLRQSPHGPDCELHAALVLYPMRDVILRGVSATGTVSFDNTTSGATAFAYPWDGGPWWRFESQQVLTTVPAPCNAKLAQVTFVFNAKTLLGSPREWSETARLLFPAH